MPAVKLWWHDGGKGPPEELGKELVSTYGRVPGNGVLFAGEKGILCSDCWGVGGVVKLKGEAKCRGVQDHEACKTVPVTLPRAPGHVGEWLRACKGGPKTFQGFDTAAMVAEIAMVGMLGIRFKPGVDAFATFAWDSEVAEGSGRAQGRRRCTPSHSAQVAVSRYFATDAPVASSQRGASGTGGAAAPRGGAKSKISKDNCRSSSSK